MVLCVYCVCVLRTTGVLSRWVTAQSLPTWVDECMQLAGTKAPPDMAGTIGSLLPWPSTAISAKFGVPMV